MKLFNKISKYKEKAFESILMFDNTKEVYLGYLDLLLECPNEKMQDFKINIMTSKKVLDGDRNSVLDSMSQY